jgi:hypothetical protein
MDIRQALLHDAKEDKLTVTGQAAEFGRYL